jgi:hypothetical protein
MITMPHVERRYWEADEPPVVWTARRPTAATEPAEERNLLRQQRDTLLAACRDALTCVTGLAGFAALEDTLTAAIAAGERPT